MHCNPPVRSRVSIHICTSPLTGSATTLQTSVLELPPAISPSRMLTSNAANRVDTRELSVLCNRGRAGRANPAKGIPRARAYEFARAAEDIPPRGATRRARARITPRLRRRREAASSLPSYPRQAMSSRAAPARDTSFLELAEEATPCLSAPSSPADPTVLCYRLCAAFLHPPSPAPAPLRRSLSEHELLIAHAQSTGRLRLASGGPFETDFSPPRMSSSTPERARTRIQRRSTRLTDVSQRGAASGF
jgi:hypothetical protein